MSTVAPGGHWTVRRAEASDGPRFLALVTALADYEKLPPPDPAAQARLLEHAFGSRPRFDLYLATRGEVTVGYAVVFETYSTFLACPSLYLEDLFVEPASRGAGAGLALLRHCVSEALARGCMRMEWVVLDWNRPAIEFYQRLGARHLGDWHTYRMEPDAMRALVARAPTP